MNYQLRGESERWLLSYYRASEIDGALFFGRLARVIRDPAVQYDLTRHFADESQHSRWWTDCMDDLGIRPIKVTSSYQDAYLEAGGAPANVMEVLAVTLAFEKRVAGSYASHLRVSTIAAPIRATLEKIMKDEGWHIQWVSKTLESLKPVYGEPAVTAAIKRYADADREVYQRTLAEHDDIVQSLNHFKAA
ncbi:MAG TPA: ferritin-like domain-containing protein [Kofleriaceae bacterium]